jgi:hypothetical protein
MSITLETFVNECRSILKKDPGPAGREEVCRLMERALKDAEFVATHVNESTPHRQVIYEDPELGFCVCAHFHPAFSEFVPHDHCDSWAIYGQVFGETEMSEWDILEPAEQGKPGRVRRARVYTLKPGMTQLYNEGVVHSPKRVSAVGLLRVEGKNTAKMNRLAFTPE